MAQGVEGDQLLQERHSCHIAEFCLRAPYHAPEIQHLKSAIQCFDIYCGVIRVMVLVLLFTDQYLDTVMPTACIDTMQL